MIQKPKGQRWCKPFIYLYKLVEPRIVVPPDSSHMTTGSIAAKGSEAIGSTRGAIAPPRRPETISSPAVATVVTRSPEAVGAIGRTVTSPRRPETISAPAVATVVTRGPEAVGAIG